MRKKKILGLIPVRLNSSRLNQKSLLLIKKIPLIIHTYRRAKLSKKLDDVIICCDDKKILKVAKKFNAKAIITSKKHKNGTERIAEVAKLFKADLFIDIHSDEAILNPKNVEKLISFHLKNKKFDIIVPHKISKSSGGKNVVKLVFNKNKKIIYFSRADVPLAFRSKKKLFFHHLDTISFKPKALKNFSKLPQGELEKIEGIELMRALENGLKLGTLPIATSSFSINTPQDFLKADKFLKKDKLFKKYYEKIKK